MMPTQKLSFRVSGTRRPTKISPSAYSPLPVLKNFCSTVAAEKKHRFAYEFLNKSKETVLVKADAKQKTLFLMPQ